MLLPSDEGGNQTRGMAETCDFPHPVVMKWTALPVRLAAKARLDPVFLQTLLADPTPIIRATSPRSCQALSADVVFQVHENTESLRNFPLPIFRPELAGQSPEAVRHLVDEETGGETGLEWVLPAAAICRAFADPDYRARLIADATDVLGVDGFGVEGVRIKVWENTPTTYHLALPVNRWKEEGLDYDALLERYVERMLACS
jgi:hypothetical protein